MDDDDEIRSQSSPPQSEDHEEPNRSSPPHTGRVSVTVAAAAPPSTTVSNEISPVTPAPPSVPLTLALPMQQPSSTPAPRSTVVSGGGSGGGREDYWSDAATSVLIDAWGERYTEHSRGNLKQKHWQEVADIVSSREDDPRKPPKTDIQCKNRIDTVKKKYKTEKAKVAAGCGPSRWPFYERLDRLIGLTAAVSAAAQKNIPVGIPVGVRQPVSTPVSPYGSSPLQRPPHLQQGYPQQQPQMRHGFATPFPQPPPPPPQRFNNLSGIYQNSHSNSNNHGNVGRMGSLNAIGRQQVMLQQQQYQHQQQLQLQQEQLLRRKGLAEMRPPVDSDSEGERLSYDSGDSLPPEMGYERRKRPRVEAKAKKGKGKRKEVKVWGNSVRELTRAILKFGEAYEAAESAKLEHVVEMEKQRMKFAKELELQRMKFLMKTQLELSQLNGSGSGSGGNSDSPGGGSSGRRDGGGDGDGDGGGGGGEESNHVNHLSGNNENHVDLANTDSSN